MIKMKYSFCPKIQTIHYRQSDLKYLGNLLFICLDDISTQARLTAMGVLKYGHFGGQRAKDQRV